MTTPRFAVAAIGNAIVDILAHADDAFLAGHGMAKGGMMLIDGSTADSLYEAMGPAIEASGGSAANTAAGIASLGGAVAYVGKVNGDLLGKVFTHDIRAIGVHFDTPALTDGPATARCMVLITPDAERTMNTYLGACTRMTPDDIDETVIADAAVTYVEGYLWDQPDAKQAILKAAKAARAAGRKVALSLSDAFCVDRHRAEFLDLIATSVDILFANEQEICHLYGVASFDEAVEKVRGQVGLAALTRGAAGSVVVTADQTVEVVAHVPDAVVDTTGAGDLYAAGFLHGLTTGRPLTDCARLGGLCAAECISHVGPRPQVSLADLVKRHLG